MGDPTIVFREKGDRRLSRERLLAARFFIYCLESAVDAMKFPRDESLFKIEMEFHPSRIRIPGADHVRAGLAERLSRIYRKIVMGRVRKDDAPIVREAVEKWMQRPEIKSMIAEGVLTGDA